MPERDIDLAAGATPTAVWSDGDTMWVADRDAGKLVAYALADGARRESRDIELGADNAAPAGLWGDGLTVWVSDVDGGPAVRLRAGLRGAGRVARRRRRRGGKRKADRHLVGRRRRCGSATPDDAKLYAYELPAETRLRGLAVGW